MTVKFTMLMQVSTNPDNVPTAVHRLGGWSESWYIGGTDPRIAVTTALAPTGIVFTRSTFLPAGCAVVGYRAQVVDPPGLSVSGSVNYPGSVLIQNPSQVALLVRVPGVGVRNVKRLYLRALPVTSQMEGEYIPSPAYQSGLTAFIMALGSWMFRGRDLSQPVFPVLTIDATGVLTASVALPYAALALVRVLKARDMSGNLRGGVFQVVSTGPGANVVKLLNWPFGATTGGTVRLSATVYPTVDSANTTPTRLVIRKVGRPFELFRGRRSRRR